MKRERKKHSKVWVIILCLFGILVLMALLFMHFGGFGTGESVNVKEFEAYADTVEHIT